MRHPQQGQGRQIMFRFWKKEKNSFSTNQTNLTKKNMEKLGENNVDLTDHLNNHVDYKLIHDHGNVLGAPAGTIPKYHIPPF